MKMVENTKDDVALDALFAAARNTPPEVSDDFLARLNADADGALPTPKTKTSDTAPPAWFGNLKGWFAASGLSGAAVFGLWIGFVMPETITNLTATTDDTFELYTFLPGADLTAPTLSE